MTETVAPARPLTMTPVASATHAAATAPVPAPSRPAALPALTGLRFIAALAVIVLHFAAYPLLGDLPGPLGPLGRAVWRLCDNSFVAVNLFFLLSGFILAHCYLTRDGGRRGTLRAYYVARLARVYPVYLACSALALLLARGAGAGNWLGQLALAQAWGAPLHGVWDAPAWTLSVEVLFYAAFPFIGAALAALSTRRLVLVGFLCYAAAFAGLLPLGSPWDALLANTTPLAHLPEFCLGTIGALLWARHPGLAVRGLATAAAACGVLVLALLPPATQSLLMVGLLDPLFLLLIIGLACGRDPLTGRLARPRAVLLGEASYALYLLHWPLWQALVALSGLTPVQARLSPLFFVGYVCAAVPLSLLLYRTVEQPARRAIRHLIA